MTSKWISLKYYWIIFLFIDHKPASFKESRKGEGGGGVG